MPRTALPRRLPGGARTARTTLLGAICLAAFLACSLPGCVGGTASVGTPVEVAREGAATPRERDGISAPSREPTPGRIGPAYEQWLQRQSMLYRGLELTEELSGSIHAWRHGAGLMDLGLMLRHAPTWLEINPWRAGLRQPAFRSVRELVPLAAAAGFGGIWLSPVDERDQVWAGDEQRDISGRGTCALAPDQAAGEERDLAALLNEIERAGLQPGGDMLPAATGLGPDFMLQARGSSRHRGLYVMVEVPGRLWDALPTATSDWDCQALPAGLASRFTAEGVLPGPMACDTLLSDGEPRGWAITGPVRGVDGQVRRMAYRWAGATCRPVLCWQDPAGGARALLSGSVIQSVGQRRQALTGMDLSAMAGLDTAPSPDAVRKDVLSPAPLALADLAGQAHRYGGWTLATGARDARGIALQLEASDFAADSETDRLVLRAMETGDASPLAAHLRSLLSAGVDFRHLAHGLHAPETVGAQDGGSRVARLARLMDGNAPASERAAAMAGALHTLLALQVGLPGLCFLPLEELVGAELPGAGQTPFPFGNAARHRQAPLDGTGARPLASPLEMLLDALEARARHDAASGIVTAITQPSTGWLACVVTLPKKGIFLTVINFSNAKGTQTIALPGNYVLESRILLAPVQPGTSRADGRAIVLSLQARQAAHILVGGSGM